MTRVGMGAASSSRKEITMPLCLNADPAMDLRKRIVWDPVKSEDVLEAQHRVDVLRNQGFTVVEGPFLPGEMVLEPPKRAADLFLLRILDDSGDTRIVWSRKSEQETKEARQKFEEHIKKGYRAYVCRLDGSKGRRIEDFDSLLEEIVLTQGRMIGGMQYPNRPAEAVMVPPTAPG